MIGHLLAESDRDEVTMETRYFHGGNKGLRVGGYILPPATTGAVSTSNPVATAGNHRTDRVYVTAVYKDAQMFASRHKKAFVYEVEPEGTLEESYTPNAISSDKTPD